MISARPMSKPNSQQRHVHVFIQTCIHAHASASPHQPASSLRAIHLCLTRLPGCLRPVCLPRLPHLPFSTRPLHPKDPPTKRLLGAESNDPHPHLPLNSVVSLMSSTRLCAINPPPSTLTHPMPTGRGPPIHARPRAFSARFPSLFLLSSLPVTSHTPVSHLTD